MRTLFWIARVSAVVLVAAGAGSTVWGQASLDDVLKYDAGQLTALLQKADAPVFAKAKACQRLAVVGTRDSVPALASLLSDETLNVYARFGLEAIPDEAASAALRDAAGRLSGRPLAGVLDSIGKRHDASAIPLLAKQLGSDDPAVAASAAGALGRIGTADSAAILKKAVGGKSSAAHAVGESCLACAEARALAGATEESASLYAVVAESTLPIHLRADAMHGLLRLKKASANERIVSLIRKEEQEFFNLGLAASRETEGPELTQAIAAELKSLPADRQALVLLALGDRADPPPPAVVIAATKSDSNAVREAAVRVLAKSGDASSVGILLDTALATSEVSASARERLKEISGTSVDEAILARFKGADRGARIVLFELIGGRQIMSARPMVKEALADPDAEVRLAALSAMGNLAEMSDLAMLIDRSTGGGAPGEAPAAQASLRTAALRMGDREECASVLAMSMEGRSIEAQIMLLELLGKVSGKRALETVVASAASTSGEVKDAATRVLGEWPNADAAPELLTIARADGEAKYRVRALRGYLRIARQLQLSSEERLLMFHSALDAAQRPEERSLAMDVLTRIPSVKTLDLAVSHLGNAEVRDAAADAAVKIAPKIIAEERKFVAEAMQKVIDSGVQGNTAARAKQLLDQARGGA